MVHDVVRFAQIKYYEEEIGRILHRMAILLLEDDDYNFALLKEKAKELLQKLEGLK